MVPPTAKPLKAWCIKHQLNHGQKYPSCHLTPTDNTELRTEIDPKIEQLFLDRILFIGEKLPDLSDERPKFVLLGIPADLLRDLNALFSKTIATKTREAYLEGQKDMYNDLWGETEKTDNQIEGAKAIILKIAAYRDRIISKRKALKPPTGEK